MSTSKAPLRLRLARALSYLYRFNGLRIARLVMSGKKPLYQVQAKLFGSVVYIQPSRSTMHQMLALEEERFIEERHILSTLVKPGDAVLDVGANIGYMALLFSRLVGGQGKVIAFEPASGNYDELSSSLSINLITNVTAVRCAVGDCEGFIGFQEALNGRVSIHHGDSSVRQAAIDNILVELKVEHVDVIKIDIEGYELRALEGARKTIEKDRPALFLEVHPNMLHEGDTLPNLINFLAPVYERFDIYLPERELDFIGRIWRRYFGVFRPVKTIGRRLEFEDVASYGNAETFWLICRRL